MAIWWLETLIRQRSQKPLFWQFGHWCWRYGGRWHRSRDICQSHYFNNPPTSGGGTMIKVTNPMAVAKATILAVWWAARPIWWRLSELLFRRFGHRTSSTSSSIGQATGVGSLLKICAYIKKSMTIRENNKKLRKNEYFIKKSSKIDKLMWVFWKSCCVK